MLDALKFVKGAVSKKDIVPALTHFRIHDGRVTGYNGKMSLSATIPLDVDCCPEAVRFIRAIEACEETAQLHLTPSGKLSIRSGRFRAHVDTLPLDVYPDVLPEGVVIDFTGLSVLPALRNLYDLSSDDATRPWATGVLLDGESAYATNNVILAEAWLGCHFPYRINVPRYAVKEMLRIGDEPTYAQVTINSITFHYSEGRWLRTQLNSGEWPDVASKFAAMPVPRDVADTPEGLFDALATLAPFTDELNRVHMLGSRVATAAEEGTSVEVAGTPDAGVYNLKMLSLLDGLATKIGLSHYPEIVPWYGNDLRGIIVGMRN